jgi:hypothetical protein
MQHLEPDEKPLWMMAYTASLRQEVHGDHKTKAASVADDAIELLRRRCSPSRPVVMDRAVATLVSMRKTPQHWSANRGSFYGQVLMLLRLLGAEGVQLEAATSGSNPVHSDPDSPITQHFAQAVVDEAIAVLKELRW